MARPRFEDIYTGAEFNKWYWLKSEMADICKKTGLPSHGNKFELRDRIMYALDHDGKTLPAKSKTFQSKFDWTRAVLTPDTVITDNITFGPNFRNFMKSHVGKKFTCHSDFMKWVRSNEGKTLQEAVHMYYELEKQKGNSSFRNEIPSHNMFNQYVRDFIDDNPGLSIREARKSWLLKRKRPASDGFIKYERDDLMLKNES